MRLKWGGKEGYFSIIQAPPHPMVEQIGGILVKGKTIVERGDRNNKICQIDQYYISNLGTTC